MMKTNGGNPEYCFFTNSPPWRIWFITKASLDFIILALSSRDGKSLGSLQDLGNPSIYIANDITKGKVVLIEVGRLKSEKDLIKD